MGAIFQRRTMPTAGAKKKVPPLRKPVTGSKLPARAPATARGGSKLPKEGAEGERRPLSARRMPADCSLKGPGIEHIGELLRSTNSVYGPSIASAQDTGK